MYVCVYVYLFAVTLVLCTMIQHMHTALQMLMGSTALESARDTDDWPARLAALVTTVLPSVRDGRKNLCAYVCMYVLCRHMYMYARMYVYVCVL